MEKNEIFVDGVGTTIIGYPISKLTFFSVSNIEKIEDGGIKEKREDVVRITILTNSLLEFCLKTIDNLYNNREAIESNSEVFKKKLDDLLLAIADKKKTNN